MYVLQDISALLALISHGFVLMVITVSQEAKTFSILLARMEPTVLLRELLLIPTV